jgi:hypothetical protein
MRKELGKWLMDIAKYVLTAVVISSAFSDVQTSSMYVLVVISIVAPLALGLVLVRDKKKGA